MPGSIRFTNSGIEQAKHPIHRATNWEVELECGISIRALAQKENVSASLVSFHLKLLRLAPEIQIFVRGLSTPAEVEFFSLRKLAMLSELDRETQLVRFKTWQRRFDSLTAENAQPASSGLAAYESRRIAELPPASA